MKLAQLVEGLLDRVHGSQLVTVYHGTSSALLPSIRKHGLLSGSQLQTLCADSLIHSPSYSRYGGGYCNTLSVTTDKDYTTQWSEEAVMLHGGEPVIMKADISRGQLVVNREMMAHTTPKEAVSSAFVLHGIIKPEHLTVIWPDGSTESLK